MKKMYMLLFLLAIAVLASGIAHGSQMPREVLASEVLEKVSRGEEVVYSNAIIIGSLNFSGLNLSRDNVGRRNIASSICINNSLINEDINLGGSRFLNSIDLSRTIFRGNADFSNSHFTSMSSFRNASFMQHADFNRTESEGWLDLSRIIFFKGAHFDQDEFNEFCNLSFTRFYEFASFRDVVFYGFAYLTGARFDNGVSFYRSEFHRETRFNGARFFGNTNFNDSRFGDYTYFPGSDFYGPLSLNRTKISDWIIDWSSINDHLIYNDATYQTVMQRLWTSGNFDAYDDCYYQYRWLKQSYRPIGIEKATDIIAWILCGYGVMPQQTFAFGIMIIVIFGIIYWKTKIVPRFDTENFSGLSRRKESTISAVSEAMYFSIMMFLTRPPYGLHPAGKWKYLIIIEYISGWLIMALFLVVMARQMIR